MRKKISLIFLITCIIISLVSCQNNKNEGEEKEQTGTGADETTKSEKTYKIGDSFTLNNIQWQVVSAKKMEEIPRKFDDPKTGEKTPHKPENGIFVVVHFKFKGNAKNEMGGFDTDVIKVVGSKGVKYGDIEPSGAIDDYRLETKIPNLSFAIINSEEEKEFMEIYDIPATAKNVNLIWYGFDKSKKVVPKVEVDLDI